MKLIFYQSCLILILVSVLCDIIVIVKFFGACLIEPKVGFIVEYCERKTLKDTITRKKQCSWKKKINMLLGIARGMEYLHKQNILHKDLKLQNILVMKDYTAKLADFDCAYQQNTFFARKTSSTKLGFTNYYTAPEIVKNRNTFTAKSDVFSFAMIMCEVLIDRENPFEEEFPDPQFIEVKMAEDDYFRPKVYKKFKQVPELKWYIHLMKRCWAADPIERPSFSEIVCIIQDNMEKMNIALTPSSLSQQAENNLLFLDSPTPSSNTWIEVNRADVKFEAQIAAGKFGVVWKAQWRGDTVAVKILKTTSAITFQELQDFKKELQTLSMVKSPHCVLLMAAGTQIPDVFLVMEQANESLFQALHKRKVIFAWNDVKRMLIRVTKGLLYLHSFQPKIVHRDLKSPNVLLFGDSGSEYRAKICDFGTAKFSKQSLSKTQVGTMQWMVCSIIHCYMHDRHPKFCAKKLMMKRLTFIVWA